MRTRPNFARRPLSYSLARLSSAAAVMVALGSARAATVTWEGNSGGTPGNATSWADVLNWSGDLLPPNNADLLFGLGTAGVIDLAGNRVANSLTFNAPFTLGAAATANTLTNTTGAINVGTGVNASINAILTGDTGLNKTGAGTLTLTGANNFTGGITVSGGILSAVVSTGASPINALGNNNVILSAGATLDLTPTSSTAAGLSGRVVSLVTNGRSSNVDFTMTATTRVDPNFTSITQPGGISATDLNYALDSLGKIRITTAGDYTFGTVSDDGSRVFIDGVLVVNNDGQKPILSPVTNTVTLSAGLHDIRVEYTQGTGGAGLVLGYSGPDQAAYGTIPASVFTQAETNTATGSSNAIVIGSGLGNNLTVSGGTSTVNLNGSEFTQVQMGNLTLATGSTLQANGLAGKTLRFAGPVQLGATAGAVTFNATADVALDGVLSDGGNAMMIQKTGSGRLILGQTTAPNTIGSTSTLDIQSGTVVLLGSSATGANSPIGAAAIKLSGTGATLLLDSKGATNGVGNTYANPITIASMGTVIQDIVNAATMTLSGGLSVPAGTSVSLDAITGGQQSATVGDPGATLVISGPLTGGGTVIVVSSRFGNAAISPPGVVAFNDLTGFTGTLTAASGGSILVNSVLANRTLSVGGGGSYTFLFDGNGLGTPGSSPVTVENLASENVAYPNSIAVVGTGVGTLIVNRAGAIALNKTLQLGTLNIGSGTLAVSNTNGYGVEFTGATTLTGAATFSVATASLSNNVSGLTLTGPVTGPFGITKTGAGTLVLKNDANNFTGDINITGGALAFSTLAQLGDPNNQIILNGTGATLRVLGSGGIILPVTQPITVTGAATSSIEVVEDQTLTVNSALGAPVGAGFTKGDLGTLILTAPSGLNGTVVINQGAVRILDGLALGNATVSISAVPNAALQLSGNISIANPIILNSNAAVNNGSGGFNFGGVLQSVSGNNIVTGPLTLMADAIIGADAGAGLDINGGINNPTTTAHAIVFNVGATGTINLNSDLTAATATANQYTAFNKYGAGTLNVSVALSVAATAATSLNVFGGTLRLTGSGMISAAPTIVLTVQPGATLTLDEAAGVLGNRLSGRPLALTGANFNYFGNDFNPSTETLGALTSNRGLSIVTVTAGVGQQADLTFGVPNNPTPGQNGTPTGATVLFRGTNLGNAAGPDTATIHSGTTGFTFIGAGAAGATNKGILPWALISPSPTGLGVSFATADTATGNLRPLAVSEFVYDTFSAGNNVDLTTGATLIPATVTVNSLTIDGGTGATIATGQTLTITSGGILVKNGNGATIAGGVISAPNTIAPLTIHALGDLEITSVLSGGNGTSASSPSMVKSGAGTLTLSPPLSAISGASGSTLSGQTVINAGTLKLNGGNNTIQPNNYFEVGLGGMLDLNGNVQQTFALFTDGTAPNTGGTVTSLHGTGTFIANQDNAARNFAGRITGPVNFVRSGLSTTSLYSGSDYTGTTLLNGGTTILRDGAQFSGTSAIGVNFAGLTLDNNVAATGSTGTGRTDLGDRINDAATITFRTGILTIFGRANSVSHENFGPLVLGLGETNFGFSPGGSGVSSLEVRFDSITTMNGATLNFNPTVGGIGNTARVYFTTVPTLINNILPYAQSGGNAPMTYVPGLGLAALNAVGAPGYDAAAFPAAPAPTLNLGLVSNAFTVPDVTTGAAGTYGINSITFTPNGAGQSLIFADGADTLNLTSGLLLRNAATNIAGNIGATVDSGRVTAGGTGAATGLLKEFYLVATNPGVLTFNSRIIDNPNGDKVRLNITPYLASVVTITNGLNSYSGGTIVNGGVSANFSGTLIIAAGGLLPAGGLTVNQATVTQQPGGLINAGNDVVTLNSGAVLNLAGTNSFQQLVLNNLGGTGPTLNNLFPANVLTIGAGGIVGKSSNVTTVSSLTGRYDFGAAGVGFAVEPVQADGIEFNPLVATLNVQGISGTAGGITKSGTGVLGITGQQTYSSPTHVTGGGLNFALGTVAIIGPASGSRYSAYTFDAGTRLNLLNDGVIGSLAGGGIVTNSSITARTLGLGFDNSSTTFSGQFARFSDAFPASTLIVKIGTGTMTLTGASTNTSTLTVQRGGVRFAGPGKAMFATYTVNAGGALTLDNRDAAGGNVNGRLGGATAVGILALGGGSFTAFGSDTAATPTAETIGTLTFSSGGNLLTLNAIGGNALALTVGTTFSGVQTGGAAVLRGNGFGAAPADGVPSISLGAIALGAPTGAGTGANGTQTMPIRPDLLGGDTASSLGIAFITKDSAGGFLRPLASGELATALAITTATTTNVGLSATNVLTGATTASINPSFSLTLNSGGGVSLGSPASLGLFGPVGLVDTRVLSGGILAFAGNTGITSGLLETQGNLPFQFHAVGTTTTLAVNAYLGNTTGGLNKSDDGTVSLKKTTYYTGTTTVNAGTLSLESGVDNSIQAVTTAAAPTASALVVNGGVLDLHGNNQIVGALSSANPYVGGSIKNSLTGTPANFTTITVAGTYGGTIDGNLNFAKTGNAVLTLTSASTYTGTTIIRGNTLTLRDSGSLASTMGITAYFSSGLTIDNSALNPVLNPTRVPAASPLTLQGGTLTVIGGGSADSSVTFNTVNLLNGHSNIANAAQTTATTSVLNIGNLTTSGMDATVNFSGGSSTGFLNAAPGIGASEIFVSSINGNAIPAVITNKILGGWAVVNNGEFATYISPTTPGAAGVNYGVVAMNGFAAIPQSQYDFNQTTFPASTPTANVRLTTVGVNTVPAGGVLYNVLAVRAATTTISFAAPTDVLNLVSGGLALTNGGTILGSTTTGGIVTSGGAQSSGLAPLYVFGTTATINAVIANNGSGAQTRLVATPVAALTLGNVNTYTGGTVVNGPGTLTLNGAAPSVAQIAAGQAEIPAGGLTLNNAAVTLTATAGQIDPTNVVTINGGGVLTLVGGNTLPRLVFSNLGGTAVPTVATVGVLTLSQPNAITATNDNPATVPTVAGTLIFSDLAPVISSTGAAPTNLTISALITSSAGPLTKMGAGSLVLSSANTFTSGFNLAEGTLIVGANTTGTAPAITAGPIGTGTLTIGNNTTFYAAAGAALTFGNPILVSGNFTLGGTSSATTVHTITLSGVMTLDTGAHTISVLSPLLTDVISGKITGASSTGLTKGGPGTLTLSSAVNDYAGPTNITGGTLKIGNVLAIPTTSLVNISAGAVLDLNNVGSVVLRGLTGDGLLANSGATALVVFVGGTTTTDTTSAIDSSFNGSIGNAAGAVSLTKVGIGNLTLSGASSFTGGAVLLNFSNTTGGGKITIANSLALGVGAKTVTGLTTAATSVGALHLDGSTANGPVILGSNITITGYALAPIIVNDAGNNTIAGPLSAANGGSGFFGLESDAGKLLVTGGITAAAAGRVVALRGAGTGEISGSISSTNAPSVTKSDEGVWTLSGVNTYTGTTTITAGGLLVNGNINASATTVTGLTALIGGSGIAAGVAVSSGGTVSPGGNAPASTYGVLTTTTTTFAAGTHLKIEVGSTGVAGTAYDQLVTSTGITLANATLDLSSVQIGATGDLFTIVLNNSVGPVSGIFAGLPNGTIFSVAGGQAYQISYFDNASTPAFETVTGVGNNDVTLMAVPEPTSAMLLLAGCGLAAGLRRSRRKTA